MNFSLIVPAHNASRTIGRCLEAIFNSDFKNFEVVVIDDASNDPTVEIAKKFPCRIVGTEKRLGTHHIRNMAKDESRYDTLVYIDSDILIKPDTLSKIEHSFREEPGVAAVVGVLSKEHPSNGYFSQYKNLYMHYILNMRSSRYIQSRNCIQSKMNILSMLNILNRQKFRYTRSILILSNNPSNPIGMKNQNKKKGLSTWSIQRP